jgi:hypothetical protein
MNAARYFMRREDYEPPRTPSESKFRKFDVKCLECNSDRLTFAVDYDDEAGEIRLVLNCPCCRQSEAVRVG